MVIPSLHEWHPLVLLEGMAHVLPIVTSAVGGIPELVRDDENGLLVLPKDTRALEMAIASLLADTELRRRMRAEARRTYEAGFTVRRMISEMSAAYNELLR
ncbi:MAG: glycosyltransferase [Patescibacteria group bacterium]